MTHSFARRLLCLGLTLLLLAGLTVSAGAAGLLGPRPVSPLPDEACVFQDLSATDWYYPDVMEAVELGMMKGISDTRFAPNDSFTRGMLVASLYRMDGSPQVTFSQKFTDVGEGLYYSNAVIWAAENGLVEGSDGRFSPDNAISRQELATILWRYARYKGYDVGAHGLIVPDFADRGSIAPWAGEAVCWAYTRGILQGSNNRLDPEGSASRAEAAAMLVRFQKLPKSSDKNLVAR